jgi:hypothetical protein
MHGVLIVIALNLAAATTAPKAEQKECPLLAEKLETCTPYTCTYKHPFADIKLERKILGLKNGKCGYVETMPNNGRMECSYDEAARKSLAKLSRLLVNAKETSSKTSYKNGKQVTVTLVDGVEVDNPVATALENGNCKILGYQ